MFENGFPCELQIKLHKVLGVISMKTLGNITKGSVDDYNNENYLLFDGSTISFPYRIYFIDEEKVFSNLQDREEQLIYNCIFSRSCDGFVRQKHIRQILNCDFPEWCMPYILKASSEYVEETVSDIYYSLYLKDNTLFQAFCANNPYMFRYAYSRMTSYWNEFYRNNCFDFHSFDGYKLYKKCFGYSRIYEKL